MSAPQNLFNLNSAELIELALCREEAMLADTGALVVETGKRTGRSPADRYLVRDEAINSQIAWGARNQPLEPSKFDALWTRVDEFMRDKECIVNQLHVGQHEQFYLPLQVVADTAWQSLFARNMFIRPTRFNPLEQPLWELRSAVGFVCDPARDGVSSDGVVMINFSQRKVLLAGMRYAGEMKKAMFSVQNFLLPEHDILPMHCAANVQQRGDVTLLFGLSGTGKTTLSADPDCELIGDDEHAWAEGSVFNLEGGCYAKCINLSRDNEPVIWDAIRFGSIIENVVCDQETRRADYADASLTENSRCSYPREHILLRCQANCAGEPKAIVFLTCDVYGVLPPVSLLSLEAAAYHFLSGYTAKVGSTELGSAEGIKPTFSTCFGAPFFPRPASVYADLLMRRIKAFDSRVFLVNTGWMGGSGESGGGGQRFPIPVSRAIISAIQSGELYNTPTKHLPNLNLNIPLRVSGVNTEWLDPRQAWSSSKAYDEKCLRLIKHFVENFAQFDVDDDIVAAGPRLSV